MCLSRPSGAGAPSRIHALQEGPPRQPKLRPDRPIKVSRLSGGKHPGPKNFRKPAALPRCCATGSGLRIDDRRLPVLGGRRHRRGPRRPAWFPPGGACLDGDMTVVAQTQVFTCARSGPHADPVITDRNRPNGCDHSGAAFTERGQQHVFSASDVDRCRHGRL